MPVDFTAVIHPDTLGNSLVLNLLPVVGATVPDVIVKVYSISPFINSYTEEQRAALYPGQSTEVNYEFVNYTTDSAYHNYSDGVLRLAMPVGSTVSSIMVVGRDNGSTQFSNHIILGPFNTDGNGWQRHVDEDFPAPAAPSSDPVVEAVSQSGNNVSYTVGARLLYGKQASWYAAAYRYTDAAGATTPVVFKKAFGTLVNVPPNTVDIPVRLGNGTYYLRPVILNSAQEVVAMGPISTQAYTGGPSAKFLLTDAGNGSLSGSISRAEFASADASWSAVCRYYSAESVQLYNPLDTISVPFGSNNSVAVTIPALTNGASYYLRVYVNNGSAIVGESAMYGPYVPNDPASYFTDPTTVDIASIPNTVFAAATADQLNSIVSSGLVGSMTSTQLSNVSVSNSTGATLTAFLDRAAAVSTSALSDIIDRMSTAQVSALSANLTGASTSVMYSATTDVAASYVATSGIVAGSVAKDKLDKALSVLGQITKGMMTTPTAGTVSHNGKSIALVPSATAAASNIKVAVPVSADEVYISGSAGNAVTVSNLADTASTTVSFEANGSVLVNGTAYSSTSISQVIPFGGRLMRISAIGSLTMATVAPVIDSVVSKPNGTADVFVSIPSNVHAVFRTLCVDYVTGTNAVQTLTRTIGHYDIPYQFVTPVLTPGSTYTIEAYILQGTVSSQRATTSLYANHLLELRDTDQTYGVSASSPTNTGCTALVTIHAKRLMSGAFQSDVPSENSIPIVKVNGRVYTNIWYNYLTYGMGTVFISNLFPNKTYTITIDFAGYSTVTVTRNIPAAVGETPYYPPITYVSPISHTSMNIGYGFSYNGSTMDNAKKLKVYAYANDSDIPAKTQEFDTYDTQIGAQIMSGLVTGLVNTYGYSFRASFVRGDGIETELSPISAMVFLMVEPNTNPIQVTTVVKPTVVKVTLPAGSYVETVRTVVDVAGGVLFIGYPMVSDYSRPGNSITITGYNGIPLQPNTSYKFALTGPGYTQAVISVTTPAFIPLSVPAGFTVTPSIGTLTVEWEPVANADSYDINKGTVTNYPIAGLTLVNGKYRVVYNNLLAGDTHTIAVRAKSSDELYSASAYTTAIAASSLTDVGAATFTVAAGDDSFTVSDMAAPNATSFDIQYRTGGVDSNSNSVTGPQAFSALNFNLYEVRVRGRNVNGGGAYSDWQRVTPFSSFTPDSIDSSQISTLGSTEISAIGATTIAAIPATTIADAAAASTTFAAAIQTFAATQITTLLSSASSTSTVAEIKTQTDTFMRQQAAVALATAAPIVAAPVTVTDPARLGTALSTLASDAVLNVLPIPMAPPSSSNAVPVVQVPDLAGDSNALYLAGQAGDSVRIQSATDSSKFIDVTFNSSGEPVVGGVNVAGQTFINTPFGTMVRVIQGSATFTTVRYLDIMRTNVASGVKLQVLLNTINYNGLTLNVQTQRRVGTTLTNVGSPSTYTITSTDNTNKYVSYTVSGLTSGDDYRFIAWVSDSTGGESPRSATAFGTWTSDTTADKLTFKGITYTNTSFDINLFIPNWSQMDNATSRIAKPYYTTDLQLGAPYASLMQNQIPANRDYFVRYDNPLPGTLYDVAIVYAGRTYMYRVKSLGTPHVARLSGAEVPTTSYDVNLVASDNDLTEVSAYTTSLTTGSFAKTGSELGYVSTYRHSGLTNGASYSGVTYGASGYTASVPAPVATTLVAAPAPAAICFLADAPVLTPAGYRPISAIAVGDLVRTAAGRDVAVKRVFAKEYTAGPAVNPFVIPKGSFGALRALPISPNHEVMVAGRGMVKAKDLGLKRMKMAGSFTYYNLELEDWVRDNLVVAGVECESLAPASRITMTKAEFARFVRARYGPAAAARLRTVCFEEADGSVSMPAL